MLYLLIVLYFIASISITIFALSKNGDKEVFFWLELSAILYFIGLFSLTYYLLLGGS